MSSKQSKFFFGSNRNKPKPNLFRLFFGLFRETKKHFFRFVSVCFGVSDRYRNNQNKHNFVETNRKISKKRFLLGGPRNSSFLFFSVRTETNRKSICFGCFSVCFLQNQIIFSSVCFGVSDRYRNNRNKQNLRYGELKRLIF